MKRTRTEKFKHPLYGFDVEREWEEISAEDLKEFLREPEDMQEPTIFCFGGTVYEPHILNGEIVLMEDPDSHDNPKILSIEESEDIVRNTKIERSPVIWL